MSDPLTFSPFHTLLGLTPHTLDLYRPLEDGTYVLAKPLLFHWTVIRGYQDDEMGYFDRWCFATEDLARTALASFPQHPDSTFDPPGWHRHPQSGRRRTNADPALEYIDD